MEKVWFETKDAARVRIAGNYWKGTEAKGVILLHMMPATKESWNEFAELLLKNGFQVLAIDLRGHGESTQTEGGAETIDYKNFSDEEHQASINDVLVAREFLIEKGISPENIFVGGASIGANLVLEYVAENADAIAGFSLSPGFDYRGVQAEDFIERAGQGKRFYLAAADDDNYSAETVRKLETTGDAKKTVKIYETGGHGTRLFDAHPELQKELVDFLNR